MKKAENNRISNHSNYEEYVDKYLKSEIKDFLFYRVPGQTTVDDLENMTIGMYDFLKGAWKK